ncbi:MAG: hydrolase [bacterium]
MPLVRSQFRPAWWLPGAHLQTLWPSLFRGRPSIPLQTTAIELTDGDFIELSCTGPKQGPRVLLLHGLEGSLNSHYALGLMKRLATEGFRVQLLHFRGCNGKPNRLARSYHSGDTGDLNQVLDHLGDHDLYPYAIVGFSLGGNVLLKWLGEQGLRAPVTRAMAISVPFKLGEAADRLDSGFSRLYQNHLLKSLRNKYRDKFSMIPTPLDVDVEQLQNFRDFDHHVTAPLHGFPSGKIYYRQSSSRQYIPGIRVPTLILHARNDPFMYPTTMPSERELPEAVTLEVCEKGGHVGFVSGVIPGLGRYWIDDRVIDWLNA